MRRFDNYDLHFIFEVKKGIDYKNVQYIHPLKQELVGRYIECFEEDKNVKTAIIFGSSVEFYCNSYSDLDICIERYNTEKGFRNYPDKDMQERDIVYIDAMGERLRKEIEQKGIVVFDREEEYV